jgi:hypothetical protein
MPDTAPPRAYSMMMVRLPEELRRTWSGSRLLAILGQ